MVGENLAFQDNGNFKYTLLSLIFSCETFNKLELSHLHLLGRTSISALSIVTSSVKKFLATAKFLVKQGGQRRKSCVSFVVKVLIFRITFMNESREVLSVSSITLSCKDSALCPRCDAPARNPQRKRS